jgi:hypothetical protein
MPRDLPAREPAVHLTRKERAAEQIHQLSDLENDETRQELAAADLVFGHDAAKYGEPVLFFGRARLQRAAAEKRSMLASVFRVQYDSRKDQLQRLVEAVRTLKGSCCYADDTNRT